MGNEPRRRLAVIAAPVAPDVDKHAPLLDAIAANPEDDAAWAVYADLLESEGHPRGELMSVMIERERMPTSRLFETQRRQLATNAAVLQPKELPPAAVVGWRRGFASELRLEAPEQLAMAERDRSLQFVLHATLAIDVATWSAWHAALRAAKAPWRHVRLELRGDAACKIQVAALFACCSQVESLRVVIPFDAPFRVDFTDARALLLAQLVLQNAGEIPSLDDADLPSLAELRLLGQTTASLALRESLRWSRLERAVGPEAEEEEEEEEDWDDDEEPEDDAYYAPDGTRRLPATSVFVAAGVPIEAAVLAKLATRMSIGHLSARIATVRGRSRPLTVMQLYGTPDAELLPYGLALALRAVFPSAPPLVLVETTDTQARVLVLGDKETRAKHVDRKDVVRSAIDLAIGEDLGMHLLDEIQDELAATELQCLLGRGGDELLTMIDPSTQPLAAEDPHWQDYDNPDPEDEEHEDDGCSSDYYFEDPSELPCEEPPTEVVMIDEASDELEFDADDETEDALAPQPQREEYWFEFEEHWVERACAVDDEEGAIRWPDPDRTVEDPDVIERRAAEPACVRHHRALDACTQCSEPHCVECGGEDYCAPCFAALMEAVAASPERQAPG
jgi:uncharacterized protein (TIGR02996 family)